jgi:hypothetical protein
MNDPDQHQAAKHIGRQSNDLGVPDHGGLFADGRYPHANLMAKHGPLLSDEHYPFRQSVSVLLRHIDSNSASR